jgi:signal transduction histidine kinase
VDNLPRAVDQQTHEPVGERRLIDLGGVLSTVVAGIRAENVRMTTLVGPVWVTADPRLLEVALGHLLSNALIFGEGPGAGVTAHIALPAARLL